MCVGVVWPVVIWNCVVYSYKGWLVMASAAYSVFSGVLLYPAAEVIANCRMPTHATHSTIPTSAIFLNSRLFRLTRTCSLQICMKSSHCCINRHWTAVLAVLWLVHFYPTIILFLYNWPGGIDENSLAMFCHWSLSLFLRAVPKTGNGAKVYDFMHFCEYIFKAGGWVFPAMASDDYWAIQVLTGPFCYVHLSLVVFSHTCGTNLQNTTQWLDEKLCCNWATAGSTLNNLLGGDSH